MDALQQIQLLTTAVGVSGQEQAVSDQLVTLLTPYAHAVSVDNFGNVIATIHPPKEGTPTLLLEAHLDETGMIVNYIDDDGFLKVSACGGVDRRILLGQEVTVHGIQSLAGVVATIPPHLSQGDGDSVVKMDDVVIDIGYDKATAERLVALGDRVTLKGDFHQLLGRRIASKSLDNRIGVVAVLQAVQQLATLEVNAGLQVLFSVQEEVGLRGATMAGYRLKPDWAMVVDVSFAQTPDADPVHSFPLGGGVLIGRSPYLSRDWSDRLIAIANAKNIPHQIEVMSGATGTTADTLGVQRGGCQVSLLSIPQRYMHTPIEVVDLDDLDATVDLITATITAQFGGH